MGGSSGLGAEACEGLGLDIGAVEDADLLGADGQATELQPSRTSCKFEWGLGKYRTPSLLRCSMACRLASFH
jgi:hypothetical protein